MNPEFSPITRLHQYFSSLLDGSAKRLVLIFGVGGYKSFDEWGKDHSIFKS